MAKSRVKIKGEVEGAVAEKKREAILKGVFNARKLNKVGGAYMVSLPVMWLRLYAWRVDGSFWVKLTSSEGKLVVEPVDRERAVKVMEVNDVKIKEE